MKILAHRGYWNNKIKKNSPEALRMALENGYGFESDVRDYLGKLVISHDIADETCQDIEEIFQWLKEFGDLYCFAINVKADGLKENLKVIVEKYRVENYFLFDMSVPQMVEFRERGLRFFTRQSEIEPNPCMYEDAIGVWLDGFWSTDWITSEIIDGHIKKGKEVCLVSPELHGRKNYKRYWTNLKEKKIDFDKVILCTDFPDEAKEVFYGK